MRARGSAASAMSKRYRGPGLRDLAELLVIDGLSFSRFFFGVNGNDCELRNCFQCVNSMASLAKSFLGAMKIVRLDEQVIGVEC